MNCRATILSVADVSHIAALPDDYMSMLLLDMHEGMITKGDVALFNGAERVILDVATNTEFFAEYSEGAIGVAVGGAPVDAQGNIGRSLIVAGDA